MDNTRLTIACEENREGGYEIDVTFERDSRTKFREAFISLVDLCHHTLLKKVI